MSIVHSAAAEGFQLIRLTGGEPLLRNGLDRLVRDQLEPPCSRLFEIIVQNMIENQYRKEQLKQMDAEFNFYTTWKCHISRLLSKAFI